MKPKFGIHPFFPAQIALSLGLALAGLSTQAQAAPVTHTWTPAVTDNWNALTRWSNAPTGDGPTGAGNIVQQTSTASPAPQTTLNVSGIIIGQIKNTPASGRSWTIADDAVNHYAVTMDNTGGSNNIAANANAAISASSSGMMNMLTSVIMKNTDLDIIMNPGSSTQNMAIGTLSTTSLTNGDASGTRILNLRFGGSSGTSQGTLSINSAIGGSGSAITINNLSTVTTTAGGKGAVTLAGPIGGAVGVGAPITITNSSTGTSAFNVSGVLGASVSSLTQNSTSSNPMTVSGANTNYTGTTNISAGTVQANANTILGNLILGTATTNGTLNTNAKTVTVTGLTTAVGATLASQTVNGGGTLVFAGGSSEYNGIITGTNTKLTVTSGALTLNGAGNSHTGLNTINGGTLNINSNWALGGALYAGLTFGAGGGTLQYNSTLLGGATYDLTANSLGVAKAVTLTGNATVDTNGNDITFANTFGASGAGGFTKAGSGILTLSGTATYLGNTTVGGGTLKLGLASSANPISSSPKVTVAAGAILDVTSLTDGTIALGTAQTLSGSGSVSGGVVTQAGSKIAPGASVGTLTVGSLSLAVDSVLDYEFNTTPANDKIVVGTAAGLTINGGGVNLYEEGGSTQFSTVGTYDLIQYSGGLTGSAASLSVLNPNATRNYAFSSDGSFVKLAITAATVSIWNQTGGGAWGTAGNWTGAGLPNGSGASAIFGSSIVAPSTVTLNGNRTIGTLGFDNANSYTIAQGTSGTLYLDNTLNTAQAQIINTNGNQVISAPVSLTSDTVVSVANAGNTLTMSGGISGAGALTKSGLGTLDLTVANTYSGATTLAGGTTRFAAGSLGSSGILTFNGGTLRWAAGNTEDITVGNLVNLNAGGALLDTNGNNVGLTSDLGNSGPGALIKTGAGDLDLQGANTYGGSTTIQQGSITLISDGGLGTDPGSPTVNSLVIGNASLRAAGTFTLSSNRGITLSDAATNINVASGATLSSAGTVEGAGTLNLTGSGGTLALTGTKSYTGGTVVTDATLRSNGNLPANIVLNGSGGLTYTGTATVTGLTVNGTNTVADTAGAGVILTIGSITAGSGTLNLNHTYVTDFSGSWGTFNGSIVLNGGGSYRLNGTGGSGNVTVDLNGYTMFMRATSTAVAIGALTGSTTSVLSGPSNSAQTVTYTVGAKNVSTNYAGAITNGGGGGKAALTKTGTETLTLSGTSTYTGNTRVSAGTLAVESTTALGSDVAGTIVDGNDVNSKVTITGSLTLTEPWTLGGRQGANASSPAIVSLSGDNILSGLVTPNTGGNNYNIESAAGTLKMAGDFVPAGSVTGARSLQLQGAAPGEWSGSIQNGTAVITVNCKGTGGWTLSGTNTYTGDTMIDSGATLALSSTGHLKFAPGANGISGRVTGDGTASLNGIFDIDLTAAEPVDGNAWTLVNVNSVTYGSNFTVDGFTDSGTTWTKTDGDKTWTFNESNGQLSLVHAGYQGWIGGYGLTGGNAAADFDYDNDGIDNGIEWVIGGNPTTATEGTKMPSLTKVPGGFNFVFRRTDVSISANPTVQHDADMAGAWTPAVNSVDGVTVTVVDDGYGLGVDQVTVFIPTTATKHFARLTIAIP